MNDLDWLARNVHEWPETPVMITPGGPMFKHGATFYPDRCLMRDHFGLEYCFAKSDWLARRAELQNRPSWSEAPAWAEWLGQDNEGDWFWESHKPDPKDGFWSSQVGAKSAHAGVGLPLGDWRDTLEKRPDANEMPAHSNQPKPSTDIPECAELKQFEPFVSVEDAATAKQPAPKGSGNPILGMVLADLTNRAFEGKEKYGEPLLAHNGRNPLWDAYQEALDLAMYLRQAIEEQE